MNIGNISIPHGLCLAPMAGATDRTFRAICREYGAEYTVSEMISAKALCYDQLSKKATMPSASVELATIYESEMPIAIQLFGSEPELMARAAEMIVLREYRGCVSEISPAAIDINMGCPMKKIVSNGEGSALMRSPELAADIVSAVKRAVSVPVTVKIRAGWDSVTAPEFAKRMEAAGADMICVHARTREQMYAPGVDISVIADVKRAVSVPVVGNGDVYTLQDAKEMLERTGCDGIMVARGALGEPWLFSQIRAYLDGGIHTPPTSADRLDTAKRHLFMMLDDKPERRALAEAKKHVAWYIKDIRGAAAARDAVMCAETPAAMAAVLDKLKNNIE